jgi:hypothetical protein
MVTPPANERRPNPSIDIATRTSIRVKPRAAALLHDENTTVVGMD